MAYHKPYRGTAGAYSTRPQLHQKNGRWFARGQIEQWKASLADIVAAAEIALEVPGESSATVTVAHSSGTSDNYESLPAFSDALERIDTDSVLTVRVHAKAGTDGDAVILVRRHIPAVLVEVAGADRAAVLGLAELIHARLMVGYVDPLGGWRAMLWLSSLMLPLAFAVAITGGDIRDWSITARIVLGALLVGATFAVIPWGYRLVRKKVPLEFTVGSSPERGPLTAWVRPFVQHRWVRRIASVVWLLTIGVVASKIAEWL